MGNSGADMAKEKDGKKVNSVSAQTRAGESREPGIDAEGGSNNELNALRNAATRSTTGQDDFKSKPDPAKNTLATSSVDDYHKQINDQLLQNGTKTSDIAYNFEGNPIVTYDAKGNPIAISLGDQAEAIRRASEFDAKKFANSGNDDVYSRVSLALGDAASSILTGLDGAGERSIEGIKEAVVEGGKAAGEAIGKTVDELKTNKELQKYSGIALGAGVLPIAMATGVAAAPTLGRVGATASGIVENVAQAAAIKVATTRGAKDTLDFVKGLNPFDGEAKSPSSLAEAVGNIIPDIFENISNSRKK